MRRAAFLSIMLLALLGLPAVWAQGTVPGPKKEPAGQQGKKGQAADRQGKLKVGDKAPDFKLKDIEGEKTVVLAQLAGKPVVLYFGSCT